MKELTGPQKLWVAALRSEKYEQTKDILEDNFGFCCLGVACKIADQHGVFVRKHDDGTLIGGDLSDQPDVQKWLGLKSSYGGLPEKTGSGLTELNDSGKTFKELADIIEQYSDVLFVGE